MQYDATKNLGICFWTCEGQEVVESSQDGFKNGKLCLASLIVFYDEMTVLGEGRAMTVILASVILSTLFSYEFLIDSLMSHC